MLSGSSEAAGFIVVRPSSLSFIRACWIHRGAPFGSSGSAGDTGFIRVRPVGRRVLPGSLRSLGCALGVFGFIQGHWVPPWVSSGSSGVAGFIVVHSGRRLGVPCGTLGSSKVAGFTGVHPGCRRVHPGLLGSLGCPLGIVGFIRDRWVHWVAHLWLLSLSGVAKFIGGHRVHPGSSLG